MGAELKILAVGDPAVEVYVDPHRGILSRYEMEQNIKIIFDIIPWAEYYGAMTETFEGKRDYDIVMVAGHLWSRDFVEKGWLAPVSYPADEDYDVMDILPVVREEMEVNGIRYLYPSFCDGHMILYRRSLVESTLGHSLGDVVNTDTLVSAVGAVHRKNGILGIALKAHPSEIFLDVLPYLRNAGIDAFDKNSHMPCFFNEQGMAGVNQYLSLRAYAPEDTAAFGNEEVCKAFQKRQVAFAVTWGGQMDVVMNNQCEEPEDVGFATFKTPWNVTWSFGINARSAKKKEANDFLAYITGKEVDRMVGSHAGSPVRCSTYEWDGDKYPWYRMHLGMIRDFAKPLPKMSRAGEKLGHLYTQLAEAFQNRKTVAQALSDADREIRKICEGIGSL